MDLTFLLTLLFAAISADVSWCNHATTWCNKTCVRWKKKKKRQLNHDDKDDSRISLQKVGNCTICYHFSHIHLMTNAHLACRFLPVFLHSVVGNNYMFILPRLQIKGLQIQRLYLFQQQMRRVFTVLTQDLCVPLHLQSSVDSGVLEGCSYIHFSSSSAVVVLTWDDWFFLLAVWLLFYLCNIINQCYIVEPGKSSCCRGSD